MVARDFLTSVELFSALSLADAGALAVLAQDGLSRRARLSSGIGSRAARPAWTFRESATFPSPRPTGR
jgi:hypothetical protein